MKFKIGALYLNTDHIVRAKVAQARNGEGDLVAEKYRLEVNTVDGKEFHLPSSDMSYQRIIDVLNSEFIDLSPVDK